MYNKFGRGKEGAKENKIKNKREQVFKLNESGNVKSTRDLENNINVLARDTSGDMKIDRQKWIDMVVALGGVHNADGLNWGKVNVGRLKFHTAGISLPDDCSTFFRFFKGEIYGCESLNTSDVINMSFMFRWTAKADPNVSNWNTSKVINMAEMFFWAHKARPNVYNWDTSKVTNMQFMFCNAGNAEPNVSNWNISNVINMERMFTNTRVVSLDLSKWILNKELLNNSKNAANMFNSCNQLKRLKTPTGLRTIIRVAKGDFKIVKLKKYNQVMIEKESQSLNDEYEINKDGDSEAIYHIYNKNVYAGVTFDKNGAKKRRGSTMRL